MGGKLSKSKQYQHSSPKYGHPSLPGSSTVSRYTRITDNYNSLEQVSEALDLAGLESSNLIVGIDFTKSNEWTGATSFNHRSLHHLGDSLNPYEQAISIIGKTLSHYDEDDLIPCFGFGDASTHDKDVFSFYPDNRQCNGFEEALARYRELVPQIQLAGPTSFAPIIETAIDIVENSDGMFHVLVIIADGQFVNFTEIMSRNISTNNEEEFALAVLMEIPSQFRATLELQRLSCQKGALGRISLPPPITNLAPANSAGYHHSASAPQSEYPPHNIQT